MDFDIKKLKPTITDILSYPEFLDFSIGAKEIFRWNKQRGFELVYEKAFHDFNKIFANYEGAWSSSYDVVELTQVFSWELDAYQIMLLFTVAQTENKILFGEQAYQLYQTNMPQYVKIWEERSSFEEWRKALISMLENLLLSQQELDKKYKSLAKNSFITWFKNSIVLITHGRLISVYNAIVGKKAMKEVQREVDEILKK